MLGIARGLRKTRERLFGPIQDLVSSRGFGDDLLEEVEEILISADVGVEATDRIIERLRERVGPGKAGTGQLNSIMREEILSIIDEVYEHEPPQGAPRVIIVVGVNGVGKTSTIGKLAHVIRTGGESVILAACDTFRAAAIEQLELWAVRAGVAVVRQRMGADPAAVAFDAVQSAVARGIDVVIADTAGRLHTKVNLMDELKKIIRVVSKRIEGVALEVWLVLDAITGQNSIRQAEAFTDSLPVTGLVLTKLDSTAKGGAIIPIQSRLRLPVLYVGVGEGIEDIEPFDHRLFVSALFD